LKAEKKSKIASKKASPKWFFWVVGVFSLCVLGLLLIGNFSKTEAVINYKNQPYIGDAAAPVKIVEFGDYKCPVCKNFNATNFPQIKEKYVETGIATFYFMNDPFINTDSNRSALFAETVYQELGNETFWKFHDQLYSKQPEDSKYEAIDLYTESFLKDTLKEVANDDDTNKVMEAFQQKKAKSALEQDLLHVKNLKVDGTPTLFINGKKFEGNTWDEFNQMVEDAAKEKK